MKRAVNLLGAAWIMLAIGPIVAAQAVSVYQVGRGLNGGSSLTQFDDGGALISQWNIPETESTKSATTYGGKLYVAQLGGLINEYDLSGNYLGHFPNVASQAGNSSITPNLESDSAGNIYESFAGFAGASRTSFRLDPTGAISQTFSHPDLVFPTGIDAAANHDVYIMSSGANDVGDRLFRFTAAGAFVANYPLAQAIDPVDMAIDEARNDLYAVDFITDAVLKYDISSGAPVFLSSVLLPRRPLDVFVEPITGDVYGLLSGSTVGDTPSFKLSQSGGTLALFFSDADVPAAIVAVAVPEPTTATLLVLGMLGCGCRRRR